MAETEADVIYYLKHGRGDIQIDYYGDKCG